MNTVKLSSKGRLTIPQNIRNKLRLKPGDKVVFIEESTGRVYLANATLIAFRELVTSMQGEAATQGIVTEADVNDLVGEVRRSLPKPLPMTKPLVLTPRQFIERHL